MCEPRRSPRRCGIGLLGSWLLLLAVGRLINPVAQFGVASGAIHPAAFYKGVQRPAEVNVKSLEFLQQLLGGRETRHIFESTRRYRLQRHGELRSGLVATR